MNLSKLSTQITILLSIILLAFISYIGYMEFIMKKTEPIILTYQYFEGCPNGDTLMLNIKTAISGFEDKVILNKVMINTDELARKQKFRGSPTLLINGIDFTNLKEPINASLSCRIYAHGVPTVEVIKNRILNEIKSTD